MNHDDLDALKRVVRQANAGAPRSRQRAIGPSQAGHPCARRLAYQLLDVDPSNTGSDPWPAIVGTSVHAWLDKAFEDDNERLGRKRWLTSVKVKIPGYMSGTIDLYDTDTGTLIDHKVPGKATMQRAKAGEISEQYKVQAALYGLGLTLQGHEVQSLAIAYWPNSGLLSGAVYHQWDYDDQVAEKALQRIDSLKTATSAMGTAALPLIPPTASHCEWCPYHMPAATDITEACPGA